MIKEREYDVLECDSRFYVGGIKCNMVKCRELIIYGRIEVRGLAIIDKLVLVGNGYINLLACNETLIITRGKPFIVDRLYCRKAYLIGAKHPIVLGFTKTSEIYTSNVLIEELKTKTALFNKRTGIKKLLNCNELIFKDPHCWIEELLVKPSRVKYEYRIIEKT